METESAPLESVEVSTPNSPEGAVDQVAVVIDVDVDAPSTQGVSATVSPAKPEKQLTAKQLEKQKEREAERLKKEAEREAEKVRKQKEREDAIAKKKEEKEKERLDQLAKKEEERLRALQKKEEERLKKEAEKIEEKARKEREREEERLRKEKEKEDERLRKEAEKAEEKARKEREREEEKLRKEKEKEDAKLQKQREAERMKKQLDSFWKKTGVRTASEAIAVADDVEVVKKPKKDYIIAEDLPAGVVARQFRQGLSESEIDASIHKGTADVAELKAALLSAMKTVSKKWRARTQPQYITITCLPSNPFGGSTNSALDVDSLPRVNNRMKLLGFHENTRPAFWGTYSCQSDSINARRFYGKDMDLDYENDSDEEWEEEEENAGDCESLGGSEHEEDSASEGEEGDGFVVPDTYQEHEEGSNVERVRTATEAAIDVDEIGNDQSTVRAKKPRVAADIQPVIIGLCLTGAPDARLSAYSLENIFELPLRLPTLAVPSVSSGLSTSSAMDTSDTLTSPSKTVSGGNASAASPATPKVVMTDADIKDLAVLVHKSALSIPKLLESYCPTHAHVSKAQTERKLKALADKQRRQGDSRQLYYLKDPVQFGLPENPPLFVAPPAPEKKVAAVPMPQTAIPVVVSATPMETTPTTVSPAKVEAPKPAVAKPAVNILVPKVKQRVQPTLVAAFGNTMNTVAIASAVQQPVIKQEPIVLPPIVEDEASPMEGVENTSTSAATTAAPATQAVPSLEGKSADEPVVLDAMETPASTPARSDKPASDVVTIDDSQVTPPSSPSTTSAQTQSAEPSPVSVYTAQMLVNSSSTASSPTKLVTPKTAEECQAVIEDLNSLVSVKIDDMDSLRMSLELACEALKASPTSLSHVKPATLRSIFLHCSSTISSMPELSARGFRFLADSVLQATSNDDRTDELCATLIGDDVATFVQPVLALASSETVDLVKNAMRMYYIVASAPIDKEAYLNCITEKALPVLCVFLGHSNDYVKNYAAALLSELSELAISSEHLSAHPVITSLLSLITKPTASNVGAVKYSLRAMRTLIANDAQLLQSFDSEMKSTMKKACEGFVQPGSRVAADAQPLLALFS